MTQSGLFDSAEDEKLMKRAIELAQRAAREGDVPVGALVALNGQIVAEARNQREGSKIATHHAELLAIEEACRKLGRWRLNDCTLYVTLEPCTMCAGALVNARLGRVVYGAVDPKAGAAESLYKILADPRLNHRPQVRSGLFSEECGELLSSFFKTRRG